MDARPAADAPAGVDLPADGRRPGLRPAAAPRPGAARYGVEVYRNADALRARPRDEAVEVWVRHTSDGGRLTVARRTDGARTVAIEAQVA